MVFMPAHRTPRRPVASKSEEEPGAGTPSPDGGPTTAPAAEPLSGSVPGGWFVHVIGCADPAHLPPESHDWLQPRAPEPGEIPKIRVDRRLSPLQRVVGARVALAIGRDKPHFEEHDSSARHPGSRSRPRPRRVRHHRRVRSGRVPAACRRHAGGRDAPAGAAVRPSPAQDTTITGSRWSHAGPGCRTRWLRCTRPITTRPRW